MGMNAIELFNRVGEVDDTASELGMRPELLHAVMHQESGGNQNAVSPKGAVGVMQAMPSTAKNPGFGVQPFDPTDPHANLRGGASYLKAMLDRYQGDEEKALAAYNAGPGRVDHSGGVPNIPETQTYVKNILAHASRIAPKPATQATPQQANPQANPLAAIEAGDGREIPAGAPQPSAIDLFNSVEPDAPKETPQAAVVRLAKERQDAEGPSATSRFMSGAWENLNPVAAVEGVAHAAMHPIETGRNILGAAKEQLGKAKEDYRQGHYSEMLGHGAAAALPLVGPAAAKAGEAIGAGDVAGGLGQGAGLIGSILAPEIAGKAVKGTGRAMSGGAERIIESNLKPSPALRARNPNVEFGRTILDEKFSPGAKGELQALKRTKDLSGQVSALNAADAAQGNRYSLKPLEDNLLELRKKYLKNPQGAADVAAVDSALDELRNHPLYSKETIVSPAQPGITPAQAAAGQSYFGPTAAVTARELVPQNASVLDTMKKAIYEENPKAYGERKGAAVQSEKAVGRGLKGIMDANVDGVKELNARQSSIIPVRKALAKMGEREANKYPLGLMDIAAAGAAGLGGAAAGPIGAAPALIAMALKHPTTAFPIARGLDRIGATTRAMAPVAKASGLAGVAGQQSQNTRRRPVTMDEAQRKYQEYLASISPSDHE